MQDLDSAAGEEAGRGRSGRRRRQLTPRRQGRESPPHIRLFVRFHDQNIGRVSFVHNPNMSEVSFFTSSEILVYVIYNGCTIFHSQEPKRVYPKPVSRRPILHPLLTLLYVQLQEIGRYNLSYFHSPLAVAGLHDGSICTGRGALNSISA
jgi:hypothetical protein